MSTDDKHRIQFDLTAEALEQVDALKNATGAGTRAELFRNALRFYAWLVKHEKNGFTIQATKTVPRDDDDRNQTVIVSAPF